MKLKSSGPAKSSSGKMVARSGPVVTKKEKRLGSMAGIFQTNKEKTKAGVNPWLNAKEQYRNQIQTLANSRLWTLIFCVAAFIMAMCACLSALNTANHSNYMPYVVAVNDHGVAISSGFAKEVTKANDKVVIATIADFITSARSVTVDLALLRENIFKCYSHTLIEDPAKFKLDEWFTGNGGDDTPFSRAKEKLVAVNIRSVIKQTESTYQVDWIETDRSHKGEKLNEKAMRALVTWGYGPQKESIDEIRRNPLALYIKDFNWSEVKH